MSPGVTPTRCLRIIQRTFGVKWGVGSGITAGFKQLSTSDVGAMLFGELTTSLAFPRANRRCDKLGAPTLGKAAKLSLVKRRSFDDAPFRPSGGPPAGNGQLICASALNCSELESVGQSAKKLWSSVAPKASFGRPAGETSYDGSIKAFMQL